MPESGSKTMRLPCEEGLSVARDEQIGLDPQSDRALLCRPQIEEVRAEPPDMPRLQPCQRKDCVAADRYPKLLVFGRPEE